MPNMILYFSLFFSLFAHAKIEVLDSGILYVDDAKEFGELEGSSWYAITKSPTLIKKVKIQTTPDHDNGIAPALIIPGDSNLSFYIRGVELKEGPITDGDFDVSISDVPPTVHIDSWAVYYKSKFETKTYPGGITQKVETRELFVKYKSKEYGINKFVFNEGETPPKIAWAGDLNSDGLPEFKISFDPGEKSVPDTIYFSEKTKDGFQYISVGQIQHQGC